MRELVVPIRRRGALVKVLVRPASRATGTVGPLAAFLDTGASDTMLDLGVVESMGLVPVQQVALHVLGRDEVSFHETFAVEVALVHHNSALSWVPLTVVAGAAFQAGAAVALGRDFLRCLVFTYDGPANQAIVRW